MVHPTWEGDILWVATGPETAKAREIQANGAVDIQFQVAPDDFIHLMVRGQATVLTDQATKDRIWDVMDYDLAQFWPTHPLASVMNRQILLLQGRKKEFGFCLMHH